MKTFVYVYNTVLLFLGISKEDITGFFLNLCRLSRVVFGVRCDMGFYKFPGQSLLSTTTVVHDTALLVSDIRKEDFKGFLKALQAF